MLGGGEDPLLGSGGSSWLHCRGLPGFCCWESRSMSCSRGGPLGLKPSGVRSGLAAAEAGGWMLMGSEPAGGDLLTLHMRRHWQLCRTAWVRAEEKSRLELGT